MEEEGEQVAPGQESGKEVGEEEKLQRRPELPIRAPSEQESGMGHLTAKPDRDALRETWLPSDPKKCAHTGQSASPKYKLGL